MKGSPNSDFSPRPKSLLHADSWLWACWPGHSRACHPTSYWCRPAPDSCHKTVIVELIRLRQSTCPRTEGIWPPILLAVWAPTASCLKFVADGTGPGWFVMAVGTRFRLWVRELPPSGAFYILNWIYRYFAEESCLGKSWRAFSIFVCSFRSTVL